MDLWMLECVDLEETTKGHIEVGWSQNEINKIVKNSHQYGACERRINYSLWREDTLLTINSTLDRQSCVVASQKINK